MRHDVQARVIYLLRHGKIEMADNERRYIGQADIPLSAEGVQQANLLRVELGTKDIAAIFCSDLVRSAATAGIIAGKLGPAPVLRRDLREIGMGEWEGQTFREIAERFPAEYGKRGNSIGSYRIPGAESFAECQSRVAAAFAEIVGTTCGNLLIVGHAGINRLLLCHLLGMPVANLFRIAQDYGCINVLSEDNGQYRVTALNRVIF